MERPTEKLSNTGPEYEVRDPYGERQHGGWPTRRAYWHRGELVYLTNAENEACDREGVPANAEWPDRDAWFEDQIRIERGISTHEITPDDACRGLLWQTHEWRWDAVRQVFIGRVKPRWRDARTQEERFVEKLTEAVNEYGGN